MRKEVVNTFSDGLISDLNPINTPATALSDCLNGTLITYDGNEFSLQNDKGNKKLKYSQLPNNYVPVGTAEYGDILYIVAYNPLNNKVQVGSFPSPQTIWDNSEEITEHVDSILTQETSCNNCLFTDEEFQINGQIQHSYNQLLDKHRKLKVFYDGDEGKLKIYPGDLYQMEETETTIWSNLEKLKYYILDDNKVLHDITSEVELMSNSIIDSGSNEEYYYVSWQVPGFLAYKWDLPEIQNFELRPKTIIVSKDDESEKNKLATIYVNTQIESSDKMMENLYTENKIISQVNNTDLISKDKDVYNKQAFYNSSNNDDAIVVNDNGEDRVKLIAVPKLHWKDNHYITYDQFKTIKEFSLKDLFSEESTEFGSYTYLVKNNSDKTCTVTVKQDLQISIVAQGEISMTAFCVPLLDVINNNYNLEGLEWEQCGNNLYEGQGRNNIYELEFPHEEDIYIVKYHLTDQPSIENSGFDKYCLIIASEIMNDFDGKFDNYADIKFSQWFPKVNQILIEPTFEVGNLLEGSGEYYKENPLVDSNYWNSWKEENRAIFINSVEEATTDKFKRGFGYKYDNITATFSTPKSYLYNFFTFDRNYTGAFEGKEEQSIIFNNEGNAIITSNGTYSAMIGCEIDFKPALDSLVNVLPSSVNNAQTIESLYTTDDNIDIWNKVITIDAYRHINDSRELTTVLAWNIFDYETINENSYGLLSNIKYHREYTEDELHDIEQMKLVLESDLLNPEEYSDLKNRVLTYEYCKTLQFYKEEKQTIPFVPWWTLGSIFGDIVFAVNWAAREAINEDSLRIEENSIYQSKNTKNDTIPQELTSFIEEELRIHNVPCMVARISVNCPGDSSILDWNSDCTKFATKQHQNRFEVKEKHVKFMWGLIFRGEESPVFIPIKTTWENWNTLNINETLYTSEYRNIFKTFFQNIKFNGEYINPGSLASGYFLRKKAGEIKEINELVAGLILNSQTNSVNIVGQNSKFTKEKNDELSESLNSILGNIERPNSNFGGNVLLTNSSLYKNFSLGIEMEISKDTENWPYRGVHTTYIDAGIDDLIEINDRIVAKSIGEEQICIKKTSDIASDSNSSIGFSTNIQNKTLNNALTILSTNNYSLDIDSASYRINTNNPDTFKIMYYGTSDKVGKWTDNSAMGAALIASPITYIPNINNETEA